MNEHRIQYVRNMDKMKCLLTVKFMFEWILAKISPEDSLTGLNFSASGGFKYIHSFICSKGTATVPHQLKPYWVKI